MSVLRAANRKASQPLPNPWPALANSRFEVQFLPAQFMMLAGATGVGKTFLALDAALKMDCPTLYLSCDSDETTMVVRTTAAITGHKQKQVREVMRRGLFKEVYGDRLRNSNLKLDFDPSNPTMQDVAYILECYLELEGQYPKLIILDNLMNLESDSENDWSGMRRATKELHWLARKTKACVLVLHHTSQDFIGLVPPLRAVQGKVIQMAPVIFTVGYDGMYIYVCVAKNRFGPSDPEAKEPIKFIVDLSRASIWDEPEMVRREREHGQAA
jgi:predicted ATP-dependent serine protease